MLKLRHLDKALRFQGRMEAAAWRVLHGETSRQPPTPLGRPPALRYTRAESDEAAAGWGANCGPHSLAAALGLTLNEVRDTEAMLSFPGWMNPTRLEGVLRELRVAYHRRSGLKTTALCSGINRVQWEGSWLNPGVPVSAAYAHTHWVAQYNGHVLCNFVDPSVWIPIADWADELRRRNRPWHVTHHYVIQRSHRA